MVHQDDGIYGGVGGRVWPCANILNHWLAVNSADIRGHAVLELGAGCGACGLYAAGLGASPVVLTDGNQRCVELMSASIKSNQDAGHLAADQSVRALRLLFEDLRALPMLRPSQAEPLFDWIIGSDIIYRVVAHTHLAAMIRALLQPFHGSDTRHPVQPRCIISCEHRRSKPSAGRQEDKPWYADDVALIEFISVASKAGLVVAPLLVERRPDSLDDVFWVNDISIFEVTLATADDHL